MKLRYAWILAATLLWTGCSREEHNEAVTFAKFLNQKKAQFTAVNALESDLFNSTKSWCEGITNNGAGKGSGLAENAASATALGNSTGTVSTQLGQLRQAIYDLPLKQEYVQGVRSTLINALMKRQRTLMDVHNALQSSATDFTGFQQSRSYTGDSYPAGVSQLTTLLGSYKGPEDSFKKAIDDLKAKYGLTDAELQ